jgi:hypothetical protein
MQTLALLLAALLFAAGTATASFEASSADGRSDPSDSEIELQITTRLAGSDGPVVAHLVLPGEDPITVPLTAAGDGTWTAETVVRNADWRIVFEDVASGAASEPASLSELGFVFGRAADDVGGEDVDESPTGSPAIIAAAASGVVIFALAAVVGLGLRLRQSSPRSESDRGAGRRRGGEGLSASEGDP